MSQASDPDSAPSENLKRGYQKPTNRRRPDSVEYVVSLRTATGARTVVVTVSPLATDGAAIDIARRREGISPSAFVTGEVLPT